MVDYFSVIRRILDNDDIEGQAMFLQEIRKMKICHFLDARFSRAL
jgi:hypothetical protein